MKTVLYFVALAAVLPVGALAQQEPAQPYQIGDCYRAMWSDPRAEPVASRIGVGQTPIPLALRTSKAKANAKEKAALEFVSGSLQACQALDQSNRANYHPLTKQAVDDFEAGFRTILARAYAGDLVWGAVIDANEGNSKSFDKRLAELAALADVQQKADAERRANQAILNAQAEEQRKAALRIEFEHQKQRDIQQQMLDQQRQEQANREIMNSLMLIQSARPQPALRCRSTTFFDTVNTTCN